MIRRTSYLMVVLIALVNQIKKSRFSNGENLCQLQGGSRSQFHPRMSKRYYHPDNSATIYREHSSPQIFHANHNVLPFRVSTGAGTEHVRAKPLWTALNIQVLPRVHPVEVSGWRANKSGIR